MRQSRHATGVPGTVHSLRHASRDRVTHLGSRPFGGALAAAGRGRRRWLWLRLLLSLRPARPWGRTWPGSGHPPARQLAATYPAVPPLLASIADPALHYKWRKPPATTPRGSPRESQSLSCHFLVCPQSVSRTDYPDREWEDMVTPACLPHSKNT